MAGLTHGNGFRRASLDRDAFIADVERGCPMRRRIAAWISRIDLLDEDVLDVCIGRRKAPRDPTVVAEHDHGCTSYCCSGKINVRRFEPGEIPHEWRREIEVRIVGE
jgi:hypothetical protein